MKKTLLICLLVSLTSLISARETQHMLLRGYMNENMPITLFLTLELSECSGSMEFQGMYKYDKVSKWLPLAIHTNDDMELVGVELGFTGLMILKYYEMTLSGYWYSPDNNRKLKVRLDKVRSSQVELDRLHVLLQEKYTEYLGC